MAIAALSIDAVLPAFGELRTQFGLAPDSTAVSWVITAFFLGLAAGQLFYGPMSDRLGRKPLLYVGLALYAFGAAAAALSPSLGAVIAFRFLWGLGAAGPRSLALAMVRDRYQGEQMARTMSFVMAVFIIVPVFAPSLGAALLTVFTWPAVFWLAVVAAVALALWGTHIPETLAPERRRNVGPAALWEAARIVVGTPTTIFYGVAVMFLFGSMSAYLSSSEIIIDKVFHHGDRFPLVFGGIAVFMGLATLVNARLVPRLGLNRLLQRAAYLLVGLTAGFVVLAFATGGQPPFWTFVLAMIVILPLTTTLLPNSNTAAMGPVGAVAGMAAALIGTLSTAAGAMLGSVVASTYDGTIRPLAVGMFLFATLSAICGRTARARQPRPAS